MLQCEQGKDTKLKAGRSCYKLTVPVKPTIQRYKAEGWTFASKTSTVLEACKVDKDTRTKRVDARVTNL